MALAAPDPSGENAQPGTLAPFSCPDCGGTLWENQQGELVHYRCRIGHAYTTQSLVAKHSEAIERAMWIAYRALEERAAMLSRMARRSNEHGHKERAARFQRQAEVASRQGAELKQLLTVERPKVTAEVSAAAAQGDRSENAEYIYGKRRLREIDRRVRFLSKRLEEVRVVSEAPSDPERVFFSAWDMKCRRWAAVPRPCRCSKASSSICS